MHVFSTMAHNLGSYTQRPITGPESSGLSRKTARTERSTPKSTPSARGRTDN